MSETDLAAHRTDAETALFDFLSRKQAGEDVDFDDFCAERPQVEPELRRLWASWRDIEPLLNSALGGDDPARVLSRLLATRAEPTIQPTLSLRVVPGESGDGGPQKVLERLAGLDTPAQRYGHRGEIRSGGMGTIHRVWDERLRRHLAMKTILARDRNEPPASSSPEEGAQAPGTAGASTADEPALARFLEEAFITGQLDHPGIVPVHDLGVDEQGRLFFTMKLVKGRTFESILARVRAGEEGWTLNRALGVLLRVCEAVAYAHSKGVIHRDIKPANIMVGRYGETYLMDWGLARVLADGDGLAADMADSERVDPPVEEGDAGPEGSLGPDSWLFTQDGRVLGTPVYMSPEQARGDIELVDERSDIYALGSVLYHLLTGQLPFVEPGEIPLPFIVLMRVRRGPPVPILELAPEAPPTLVDICQRAMAREIDDRYASASEMASVLEDYLEDISEAREEARRQAQRAQRINAFLMDMLSKGDPANARGREVTVREVLDRAAQRIETALPDQALDEAALRGTIGNLYRVLGRLVQAETHLVRACELHRTLLDDEHPDTLVARTDLALLHRTQGRLEEAEQELRDTWEVQRRRCGENHPETLRTLSILASVLHGADARLEEAESLYRRVLEGRRVALGNDHPDTLATMSSFALLMMDCGRAAEAIPMQRQAMDSLLRVYGETHPETLVAMNDLAVLLDREGDLDEAGRLFRRTLENQRRVMGETHPETLTSMNNLALLLKRRGDLEEAEELLSEALEVQRTLVGNDHPNTLSYMNNLALLIEEAGRLREAEILFRESVRRAEVTLSIEHEHRSTERFRTNLGRCLARQGKHGEALRCLRQARDALRHLLGEEHPWSREAADALADSESRDQRGENTPGTRGA